MPPEITNHKIMDRKDATDSAATHNNSLCLASLCKDSNDLKTLQRTKSHDKQNLPDFFKSHPELLKQLDSTNSEMRSTAAGAQREKAGQGDFHLRDPRYPGAMQPTEIPTSKGPSIQERLEELKKAFGEAPQKPGMGIQKGGTTSDTGYGGSAIGEQERKALESAGIKMGGGTVDRGYAGSPVSEQERKDLEAAGIKMGGGTVDRGYAGRQ